MQATPSGTPPPDVIARIDDLGERALFMQAYALAKPFAPLEAWQGTAARVAASRLAHHLGAAKLSDRIALAAYRRAPRDPEVLLLWAFRLFEVRGPFFGARRLAALALPGSTSPATRARITRMRALAASALRDFDAAGALLDQAEREHPRDAASLLDRAALLERQDRLEEALAATEAALALEPLHRRVLVYAARILALLDRTDHAIDLLSAADAKLESGEIAMTLAGLQHMRGRWQDAQRSLARAEALYPLLEDEEVKNLAGRRSECAYRLGDIAAAIAEAERSTDPFLLRIAERLKERKTGKRVRLDVGFVRQHHLTCVPATLAVLSRFWGKAAEHVEIADAICYDGTPTHSERRWAEEHGFRTRELTVTWDAAVALLDRGIPFVLSTSFAASGHAQAIIGYDERRGTFDVRDPYVPSIAEAAADLFLERFRATGPRGLVIVPEGEEHRLDGIALPDAALYDALHEVDVALARHDRAAAVSALEALETKAPGHMLALRGRRALAAYDADAVAVIRAAEAQLARFPDDTNAELARLGAMKLTASREARIARIEQCLGRGPVEAIFVELLASELSADARDRPRAAITFRRMLRLAPERAEPYARLGEIAMDEGRVDDALALFRAGATVDPVQEFGPRAYFAAAWQRGRGDEGLALLARRVERAGDRSGQPAMTLADALEAMDRPKEALEAIERAIARRPDDGDLLLYAAYAHARHGREAEARAMLASAEGRAKRSAWLRAAAQIAEACGAPGEALGRWRDVLAEDPIAEDAHRALAAQLAAIEGSAAALSHVKEAAARSPHHRPLQRLLVELHADEAPKEREAAIRAFLQDEPESAWAHRELALCLADQLRAGEAREAAAAGRAIDPSSPPAAFVDARVAALDGDEAAVRAALYEVVRRAPDTAAAMGELAGRCRTAREIGELLSFLQREVLPRSATGDGILGWYLVARGLSAADGLRAPIAELRAARPDLPAIWIVAIKNLIDLDRIDDARALAIEATGRFPLAPMVWIERADLHHLAGETEAEIEAIGRALALRRTMPEAILRMVRARGVAGAPEEARALLDEALARAPRDTTLLCMLADVLARTDRDAAIERLEQAAAIAPRDPSVWDQLGALCAEAEEPQRAIARAREMAARRPWDAEVRLRLAERLADRPLDVDEALVVADEALALDPRLVGAHDLRVVALAGNGRFDEALAACSPPVFRDARPTELRGREAAVLQAAGRVQEAIAALRGLVETRPGYAFAWGQLVSLYREQQRADDELAAARGLVRAAPRLVAAWGMLAEACMSNRDSEGAVQACERAVRIDPRSASASLMLIDLLLGAQAPKRAKKALARAEGNVPAALLASRRIRLALMNGDAGGAEAAARALFLDAEASPDAVYEGVNALLSHDRMMVLELLESLLDDERANPEIGAAWVKVLGITSARPSARRVRSLYQRHGELGLRALVAAVEVRAEAREKLGVLVSVLHFRGAIAGDVRAWANLGASLSHAGLHLIAARWLGSYAGREGIEPWMLVSLVRSLRARLRTERALAVSRDALALPPDGATPLHAVWIAFEAAVAGDVRTAEEALQGVPGNLIGEAALVASLTRRVLAVQRATGRERARLADEARLTLFTEIPGGTPILPSSIGDAAVRAARRICADAGYSLDLIAWAYSTWLLLAGSLTFMIVLAFRVRGFWVFSLLAAVVVALLLALRRALARL